MSGHLQGTAAGALVLVVALSGCSGGAPDERTDEAPALPSQVLDLEDWKLTLPTEDPATGKASHVEQPALAQHQSRYMRVVDGGVELSAPAGGARTPNTRYARSELREMTDDGTELAAWSADEGRHTMTITQAITALPPERPSIVAGQIHGGDEYVLLVRLDGERLYVKADEENAGDLDTDYRLGTPFTLTIDVVDGEARVTYDGKTSVTVDVEDPGCYFKAGAYLQTSPDRGDEKDAVGAVRIDSLEVRHR